MKHTRTVAALAIAAAMAAFSASARLAGEPPAGRMAPPIRGFPESADIRSAYWMSFFCASEAELDRRAPAVVDNDYGSFLLMGKRSGGCYYAIAAATAPGAASGAEPALYAQGSWILKRSSPDGLPIQAKVFLRSDPGTFIRIYPDGDRSKLDLVAYGGVLNREVPLPVPFERAFSSSLAEIAAWTRDLVDWKLFSPEPGMYREVRAFADETRRRLPGLRYADDGALDENGIPVRIATGERQEEPTGLNCSGFAAWIADGFYRPLTGELLDPRELAARHPEARPTNAAQVYEEKLDPFFGLDWTRNIAKALLDARAPSREHALTESDVRISAFALVAPPASPGSGSSAAVNGSSTYQAFPAYQADLGYETPGLKALLYVLALREPGSIYLASFCRKAGGAIAGLSRHYHVAVLAPYFEESGEFRVAAFESDAETSVERIMARIPKDYVHLVRVRAERDYDPPAFPEK
jgi:hypothetical protein